MTGRATRRSGCRPPSWRQWVEQVTTRCPESLPLAEHIAERRRTFAGQLPAHVAEQLPDLVSTGCARVETDQFIARANRPHLAARRGRTHEHSTQP